MAICEYFVFLTNIKYMNYNNDLIIHTCNSSRSEMVKKKNNFLKSHFWKNFRNSEANLFEHLVHVQYTKILRTPFIKLSSTFLVPSCQSSVYYTSHSVFIRN